MSPDGGSGGGEDGGGVVNKESHSPPRLSKMALRLSVIR